MRVAVISDMLRATGANIMAVTNAGLLADQGHDVVLLSGSREDPSIESLLVGLEHHSFLAEDLVFDDTEGVLRHELALAAERWVNQQLVSFDPDVVICHNTGRLLDQLAVARISQRFPLAVYLHDEWFLTDQHYVTDPATPTQSHFEPYRVTSTRDHDFSGLWHVPSTAGKLMAIAPSSWLLHRWRQVFPSLPCALVHNPVSPALFDIVERDAARSTLGIHRDVELVGFVGDPSQHRKGFALLSEAVATLPESARPFLLAAGGQESAVGTRVLPHLDRDGLVARRLAAGQSTGRPAGHAPGDTLVISGVPREAFKDVYGAVDLLVHPSRIENLPTVPIEASYCGTPCLVSDVGGSREVVSDPSELFPANMAAEVLGQRIREALDRVRTEPRELRGQRRSSALSRFSPAQHYEHLMPVLTALAA